MHNCGRSPPSSSSQSWPDWWRWLIMISLLPMALVKADVGLGITVYHIPLSQPTSAVHWMRVYKAGGSLGRGRDLQSGLGLAQLC